MIIDGRMEAFHIKQAVLRDVDRLVARGIRPSLAVIVAGDDPASHLYVESKRKQALEVGIKSMVFYFRESVSRDEILDQIEKLNRDPSIHGILVQLPLPGHLDTMEILSAVDPLKDVDGLHPLNVGLLASGAPRLVPCTPLGCLHLLKIIQPDLAGRHAVLIGASRLVGRPLMHLLLNAGCTVTVTHIHTRHIASECARADILVAAAGVPGLVRADWVRAGAIVLDVGIAHITLANGERRVVGDVDFPSVESIASAITPVPGGIGPMTIACLLQNTIKATLLQNPSAQQEF